MAKSSSGKWVSRVGASGGGKSYAKTRPSNYYGALVVIVLLGLLLTVYSRYEYQNPVTATTAPQVQPAIGTTWYAGLSIQACGERLPFLTTDPNYTGGYKIYASNVVQISPKTASEAGSHATLTQFAAEYPNLLINSTKLAVPTATGAADPKTTFVNGQTCPATSKYPHQKGNVVYAYWKNFGQKTPTLTTDPSTIKFSQYLRVTMAFEPTGVTPLPPLAATNNEMVSLAQVPTTTTAPVATTTAPTTTAPTTTTTATTTTTSKG